MAWLRSARTKRRVGYLLPLQVGVEVLNAAELVAREVKAWRQEARADEIIVQVDLRNAFNLVDRNVLLLEVPQRVPPFIFVLTLATSLPQLSSAAASSWSAHAAEEGLKIQTGRTKNAKKKMQLTREKVGPRQKKRPFKMVQKNFSSAGCNLSFQGIKCKQFYQEKARNFRKICRKKKPAKKCNYTAKKCKMAQNAKKNANNCLFN